MELTKSDYAGFDRIGNLAEGVTRERLSRDASKKVEETNSASQVVEEKEDGSEALKKLKIIFQSS